MKKKCAKSWHFFAPISMKQGSAYVSEDYYIAKQYVEKKNVDNVFLAIFFRLFLADRYADPDHLPPSSPPS